MSINAPDTKPARVYLHEIDLLRAITAFTVVSIHSISTVSYLATGLASTQIINIVVHSLHYNREMFMFISGLVLTYVALSNPTFKAWQFWRRRIPVVFIPYALWTIIYVLYNNHHQSLLHYVRLSVWNIISGNASSQLYYILLTLQFYLVFPLFLGFIRRCKQYPWRVLSISLAIQLIGMYLDYHFLQNGSLSHHKNIIALDDYQNRFFLVYQFFFIMGGLAAVYIETIRAALVRYRQYIPSLLITGLSLFIWYYYVQLNRLHQTISAATSVLQPSVVLFSIVVIVFFGWVASVWAIKRPGYRFVKAISEMSFGIYFVHILILNTLVSHVLLPHVSNAVPLVVKIVGLVLVTFGLSAAICFGLSRVSWLSWTIGKFSTSLHLPRLWFKKPSITS